MSKPFVSRLGIFTARLLVNALFLVVTLMGAGAINGAFNLLRSGKQSLPVALFIAVVGLVIMMAGASFFYISYVHKPRQAAREARIAQRYPNQPWMLRSDWARRRVTSSTLGVVILTWVWTIGWWAALAFIGTVNRDKIIAAFEASWGQVALAGVFVLCGLIGLKFAIYATWAWWRYGSPELQIDTLPGYLGERFRGSVSTPLRERPKKPIEAILKCEDREWVEVRQNDKTTHEMKRHTLWSERHRIEPARLMVTPRGTIIPIDIPLPKDQPPCALDSEGNGIAWKLEIQATETTQPALSCDFEVPVYAR